MKLMRFQVQGRTACGILQGDEVTELEGDFFGPLKTRSTVLSRASVKFLAPCSPSKIIAVGLNYRDHARELELPVPEAPVLFLKLGAKPLARLQAHWIGRSSEAY